jgi:DNA-binding SARP family transcriptional activator/tetratricopeptide (TPR) repeat protein
VTGTRPVELRLLGRFVVLRDGHEIPAGEFGGRKVRALLRALATRRGSMVPHDVLTEMLWGDRPPADPAANLQVLVNRARRALGRPDLVVTGTGGYALAGGDGFVVDTEHFTAAVERAGDLAGAPALAAYREALAGWGGEPLTEDRYADWAGEFRDRLQRVRQLALEAAARLALDLGRVAQAVDYAAEAAGAEPLREAAVLPFVQSLAAAGDPAGALARYEMFRRALADELGVDPTADAQAAHARLLRGQGVPSGVRPVPRSEAGFVVLPFVGRADEVAMLAGIGDTAPLVVLLGGSGAGKSRLLDVVASRTPVVPVRAFLAEQDEAWSLARSLLREALAADATAAASLPAAIRAALAWLLPELDESAAGPAPDPESRRALLVEAAVRMLTATGSAIVVDDVQWADATSLALLEAVLDRLVATGAVLAARPDEARDRDAVAGFLARLRPRSQVVELRALTAAEIAELTDDEQLASALATATDGTPMAIAETLRALAVEGTVTATAQRRWRLAAGSTADRVAVVAADGQRRAIAARADAEPADSRDVVELLALLGREVPARILASATGRDERTVLDQLGASAQRGLVRLGERGWATAHDMVAEVVGQRPAADERGRLHGLLARALESADAEPGEVAGHWLRSGDQDRAAQAYRRAAERALDAFADGEAAALATAGLAAAPAGDDRAALQEVRAQARARLGDITGARSDLRDALTAHPRGPARARLLGRLATIASGADDLVRAAELAELALVEAGAEPEAQAGALEIAAVLDMNLDRPERAQHRSAQALTLYERLGDAKGMARVLDGRAMATFLDGEITRGTEQLQRVANLFEDSGDLVHVVTPRSTAGHGSVFGGDPARGLALTSSALETARTLGHPEREAYALWHCAEAYAESGQVDEARAAGQDALAIAQRIAHRGWTATAWRAIGIAQQRAGELDAALQSFTRSLDSSEHLNLFASWAAARAALVLVELGRFAEAAPMVDRALAEGPPLGHFEARLAQVELAAARGDESTTWLAAEALRRADAAGMRQGRDRLVGLAG